MFFFPLRTDGWERGRPWATIGVVVANYAVAVVFGCVEPYFGFLAPSDLLPSLVLDYDAFRPHTWITSAFVHADVAHLCGNMIFLLAFGTLVEGILGWRKLLALYLGIAFVSGALEQALFFGSGSASYGASGCIFGIVAAALLWAPRRHVTVFYWVWRWVGTHDAPVWTLAFWWIGWEFLFAGAAGFRLGGPILHLLGAAVGFGAALLMLKKGWVDCGDEDWLTLRAKERRAWEELRPAEKDLPPVQPPTGYELLQSFVEFWLPILAGGLIAVGLILVRIADWARPNAALAITLFALLLIAVGALLFRHWQRR